MPGCVASLARSTSRFPRTHLVTIADAQSFRTGHLHKFPCFLTNLLILCAQDEDAALLNIGLRGSDGLACFAVMAGDQWLADLDGVHADQRRLWLAAS